MAAAFSTGTLGISAAAFTAIDLGLSGHGIVIASDFNKSGQSHWRTLASVPAMPDITEGYAAPTTHGSQLQSGQSSIPPTVVANSRRGQVIGSAGGQSDSIIVVKETCSKHLL